MAPRSAVASSSKRQAATNGHAGPSRLATSVPKTSKKRPAQVEEEDEEDDEDFAMNGAELDISDDEDVEAEDASDEEDDEAFPELDSGSDGEGDDEEDKEEQDADSEAEEELDDEESGSESGYNSSDIDALYSSSTSVTSAEDEDEDEDGNERTVDEKLDRLVKKNTVKPDERIGTDMKISKAKEGYGKLRPSKMVPGGYLREYDDIEAGYGSESSTEDVSTFICPRNEVC